MEDLIPITELCFVNRSCLTSVIKFFFQITEYFFRKVLPEKTKENFLGQPRYFIFGRCGYYGIVLLQLSDQDGRDLGMIRI